LDLARERVYLFDHYPGSESGTIQRARLMRSLDRFPQDELRASWLTHSSQCDPLIDQSLRGQTLTPGLLKTSCGTPRRRFRLRVFILGDKDLRASVVNLRNSHLVFHAHK
jgi:hypothetical protein